MWNPAWDMYTSGTLYEAGIWNPAWDVDTSGTLYEAGIWNPAWDMVPRLDLEK